MFEKLKALYAKHRSTVIYLVFGVLTTVVNYAVYLPLFNFVGLPASVCNGIAWVAAVIFAYVTNKLFVFESKSWDGGVVGELIKKKPLDLRVTLTYENGETEVIKEKLLLCAVANAKWYGGGFKVAPTADLSDGLLDVMIIRNVSRRTFISFVGGCYSFGCLCE